MAHALFDCSMSRCVWALSKYEVVEHMIGTNEGNAKHWLFALMGSLSHVDFMLTCVTLWAIWMVHRKAIHENIFEPSMSTHMFVENFIDDLDQITDKEMKPNVVVRETGQLPWSPPPQGYLKIHAVCPVSKQGRHGVADAVCRDEDGNFIGSSSITLNGITDVAILEALACREA